MAEEIIKLKNEIKSTENISKNSNIEKLILIDKLEIINKSNKDLSSELTLVNSQIKEYEDILSAAGENDFFQKAKNLLGLGIDQEIIVNQLKKNNEKLSQKNIELKLKLDEVSSLNIQINQRSTDLSKESEKTKREFYKGQNENNELLIEKKKIVSELKMAQLSIQEANLKIALKTK